MIEWGGGTRQEKTRGKEVFARNLSMRQPKRFWRKVGEVRTMGANAPSSRPSGIYLGGGVVRELRTSRTAIPATMGKSVAPATSRQGTLHLSGHGNTERLGRPQKKAHRLPIITMKGNERGEWSGCEGISKGKSGQQEPNNS